MNNRTSTFVAGFPRYVKIRRDRSGTPTAAGDVSDEDMLDARSDKVGGDVGMEHQSIVAFAYHIRDTFDRWVSSKRVSD